MRGSGTALLVLVVVGWLLVFLFWLLRVRRAGKQANRQVSCGGGGGEVQKRKCECLGVMGCLTHQQVNQ